MRLFSPIVILSAAKNPIELKGILRCAQDDNEGRNSSKRFIRYALLQRGVFQHRHVAIGLAGRFGDAFAIAAL